MRNHLVVVIVAGNGQPKGSQAKKGFRRGRSPTHDHGNLCIISPENEGKTACYQKMFDDLFGKDR